MSGTTVKSKKTEPAAPVNGIPGQDLTEDQPVRNPLDQRSTVLVVGGNRGIGLEFVEQCADKGAKVIATHRGNTIPESLKFLAKENSNTEATSMDTPDENGIAEMAETLKSLDNFASLTHTIHSAGAHPKGMSFDGEPRGGRPAQPLVTKDDMMTSFLMSVAGPLMVAQVFVPLLRKAQDFDGPSKNLLVHSILTSKVGSVGDNGSGGTHAH